LLLQARTRGPRRRAGDKDRTSGTNAGKEDVPGHGRGQFLLEPSIQFGQLRRARCQRQFAQAVSNRLRLFAATAASFVRIDNQSLKSGSQFMNIILVSRRRKAPLKLDLSQKRAWLRIGGLFGLAAAIFMGIGAVT